MTDQKLGYLLSVTALVVLVYWTIDGFSNDVTPVTSDSVSIFIPLHDSSFLPTIPISFPKIRHDIPDFVGTVVMEINQNAPKDDSHIRNRSIRMERRPCPFCKINGGKMPPSFTTTWSAIWHYFHMHKGEPGFENEVEKLKEIVKLNKSTQDGGK